MTHKVTKPIALDESLNTTEETPRNIADVLAEGLAGIGEAVSTEAELPLKKVNGKFTNNGVNLTCSGDNSWAEGNRTKSTGEQSHAEGYSTEASASYAHAEGCYSKAMQGSSHAEGFNTRANAVAAHAEGYESVASGNHSHAEGSGCTASGKASHAGGLVTRMSAVGGTAIGKFNSDDNALFVVGNGTYIDNRKDAFKVDSNGQTHITNESGNLVKVRGAGIAIFTVSCSGGTYTYPDADTVLAAISNYDEVILQLVSSMEGTFNYVYDYSLITNEYRWIREDGSHVITLTGAGSPVVWTWSESSRSVGGSSDIYGSLQDAIADAASLNVGDYFETNGFHTSGDGGAARYIVNSTGTANGKNIVQLAPGKNAYLQYGEWVCPEEIGYNHSDDVVPYITHAISTMGVQHIKLLARGTYHWKTMLNVSMINGFELVGEGDWGHPRKFTYINVDPTSDITCMMKISGRSITLKNLDIEVTGTQALAIDGITCDSYSDGAEFYFNFDNIRMNSFKECWKLSGGMKWHVMFNECQPANCTIGIHIQESSSMLINMKEVYFNHCSNIGLWFEGNVFTAKMDSCNFGSMNTAVKCSVNSSTYLYQNLRFDSCNFEDDNVSVGNRAAVFFDCYDSEHLDTRQNITISNSNFTLAKSTAPVQDSTNRYFRLGKNTNLLFINNQILGMNEPDHPEWVVYPKLFWNTSVLPTQGSVVEVGNNLFFDYPNAFLPYVVRNGQSLGVNCYNAKDPTETAWTDCDTFLPRHNGEMRIARVSTFENTANMPTTSIFGYLMAFGVIENPNPRVLQVLFASNNNVYTRIIRDTGSGWTALAWKTITAT